VSSLIQYLRYLQIAVMIHEPIDKLDDFLTCQRMLSAFGWKRNVRSFSRAAFKTNMQDDLLFFYHCHIFEQKSNHSFFLT